MSGDKITLGAVALLAAAGLVRKQGSAGKVIPFQSRQRGQREAKPGHTEDVVFLTADGSSFSLSDLYGSSGIRFGTTSPYAVGVVTPDRVGYGDYPMVTVQMYGKKSGDLVPIARQLAMLNAKINGLYISMGAPSVMMGRQRMVTDQNPSSRSFGKRKRLTEMDFRFDVKGVEPQFGSLHTYVKSRYSRSRSKSIKTGQQLPLARPLMRQEILKTGIIK